MYTHTNADSHKMTVIYMYMYRGYTVHTCTCTCVATVHVHVHIETVHNRTVHTYLFLSTRIRRALLNGTGEPETLLEEPGQVEDLAVDWTTGNVYWTSNTLDANNHIAMADRDGRFRKTLVRGLGKPRGLVLHPLRK